MVIGNKIDLLNERSVSKEEGKKFVKDIQGIYFETSALYNHDKQVEHAMKTLVE